MRIEVIKNLAIPDTPGVYFFKSGTEIIYIGRATSLKSRVRSYFGDDLISTRGSRLVDMVTRADSLDWKETTSVLEAIILEAVLIKKHQPHANTDGKDDKSFNCVVVTKEAFPQVLVMRGKDIDLSKMTADSLKLQAIFGPFPEGGLLRSAMKIIRRIIPYRDDKCQPLQGRPCFNRQIGLCPGVCTGEIAQKEYSKSVRRFMLFFEGKTDRLMSSLARDMKSYARQREFEQANEIKRLMFGLQHIQDISLIKQSDENKATLRKGFRIEAYDVAHLSGKHMVGVMVVSENGSLVKGEYRSFTIRGFTTSNDVGALKEMISRRLKHSEWRTPDLVVVDGNEVQHSAAAQLFQPVSVVSVTKNERHKPVRIVGNRELSSTYEKQILLLNAEAHRFAISRHRLKARKSLLL